MDLRAYRDRYGYIPGSRASSAIAGGRVFTFGAEGRLHCLDLASGRIAWRRDVHAEFAVPRNFSAWAPARSWWSTS